MGLLSSYPHWRWWSLELEILGLYDKDGDCEISENYGSVWIDQLNIQAENSLNLR